MSKFHEEFFRKGSPAHDELIALTLNNLNEIIDKIIPIKNYYNSDLIEDVYICNYEQKSNFCSLEKQRLYNHFPPICFKNEREGYCPEENENFITEQGEKCRMLKISDKIKESDLLGDIYVIGEFIKNRYGTNPEKKRDLKSICPKEYEFKKCKYKVSHAVFKQTEIEKICRNDSFIVGYADIVVDVEYIITYDLIIDENWVITNKKTEKYYSRIIIDAKPELKSWGGPLRQLKTYMSLLSDRRLSYYKQKGTNIPIKGVITSFSDVSEEHKKLLANEGVYVHTFEKPKQNTLTNYGG